MKYLDKLLHFMAGYCVAATLAVSPIMAMVAATLVGAGKEGYDYIASKYFKIAHTVDKMDFVATVAGGVAGTAFPFLAYKYLPILYTLMI